MLPDTRAAIVDELPDRLLLTKPARRSRTQIALAFVEDRPQQPLSGKKYKKCCGGNASPMYH